MKKIDTKVQEIGKDIEQKKIFKKSLDKLKVDIAIKVRKKDKLEEEIKKLKAQTKELYKLYLHPNIMATIRKLALKRKLQATARKEKEKG